MSIKFDCLKQSVKWDIFDQKMQEKTIFQILSQFSEVFFYPFLHFTYIIR